MSLVYYFLGHSVYVINVVLPTKVRVDEYEYLVQSTCCRMTYSIFFRLKAYIVFTFLDSFQNKSGKPQPIRTNVGAHTQVKSRQRSRNVGRDWLSGGEMGGSSVPGAEVFCKQHFSATSQRPIFAKFGHDT